jgi:hypothetical protein
LERLKSRQQHNKISKETREGLDEFGERNIFKKFSREQAKEDQLIYAFFELAPPLPPLTLK